MATSEPTACHLVSCFLQLPVWSEVPLLAQVSVLLFKHTPLCAFLLQHGPDLGDPRAISGTLKRPSSFHQTCDTGQDRQAYPLKASESNPDISQDSLYTSAVTREHILTVAQCLWVRKCTACLSRWTASRLRVIFVFYFFLNEIPLCWKEFLLNAYRKQAEIVLKLDLITH